MTASFEKKYIMLIMSGLRDARRVVTGCAPRCIAA